MRTRTLTTLLTLILTAFFTWGAGAAVLADEDVLEPVAEEKEIFITTGDDDVKTWTTEDGELIVLKGDCKVDAFTDDENRMIVKVHGCEEGDLDVHELITSHCKPVPRTFLGVMLDTLTPELQVHFGSAEGTGVLVAKVVEGSPAEAAGLQVGDLITAVNGTAATSVAVATKAVREMNEGDTALVEVLRNGSPMSFEAVLATKEFSDHNMFHFDHSMPDMEGLHKCIIKLQDENGNFTFQTEDLDEAMEKLNLYLESPEFEALIEKHEANGENIEKQLEILEKRVEEME